jgi:hypothetical protein
MWPFGNIFIKADQLVIARDEKASVGVAHSEIEAPSRD